MFLAHYQHSPEDIAVGFGDTPEQAAAALVAAAPWLAGEKIDVVPIVPGTGAASLIEMPAQQVTTVLRSAIERGSANKRFV
jgi:hypothetical protein